MSYKIAVGSSDEKNVDLKFGEVGEFLIYEVNELQYQLIEKRTVKEEETSAGTSGATKDNGAKNCGNGECASSGCGGNGHGCSGPSEVAGKVGLIADCRAVVCKKIGFQAQKQFEKKAISVFDVECEVAEALDKITSYYDKIDKKISLKR